MKIHQFTKDFLLNNNITKRIKLHTFHFNVKKSAVKNIESALFNHLVILFDITFLEQVFIHIKQCITTSLDRSDE